MAFGQPGGPPASAKQVRELLELLQRAGHSDFRDARGPMGFTQRQAGGKFTRDEADAFIAQLEAELEADEQGAAVPEPSSPIAPPTPPPSRPKRPAARPGTAATSGGPADPRRDATAQLLRTLPAEQLAAELQRRGWVVMEP